MTMPKAAATKTAKAAKAAKAPKAPKAPKAAKAPKAPKAPKAVKTVKAAQAPKAVKAAQAPPAAKAKPARKPGMSLSRRMNYELPVTRVGNLLRQRMPGLRQNQVASALVTHAIETLMVDVLHHSWKEANGRKQLTPQFVKRGVHALSQTHPFVNKLWPGEIRDAGVIPLELPKRMVTSLKPAKKGK